MNKKKIKQILTDYITSIPIEKTTYFVEGKENIPSLLEEGNSITIRINDEQIDLFRYDSKDELEELYSWDAFDSFIILKEDVIKCFILNEGDLLKENIFKENIENLGFKIIVNYDEIIENSELFIANINKFMDLTNIKEKINEYSEIYKKILKDKNLYILEINNLKILEPQLKNFIEKNPKEFIRTNLVILNSQLNLNLSLFESDRILEDEKKIYENKNILLSKYPFYIDLIHFLESAQKMHLNHLKYIEYYHILEYFISAYALKNMDETLKRLVSLYLENGNHEELKTILKEITEESRKIDLEKDESLIDILKQIDLSFIINIINSYELYNLLNQDIFNIKSSRLFEEKWLVKDSDKITKIKEESIMKDEFYKKLYNRIYGIRNALIHSKAKFRGKQGLDFIPTPDYEKKLKEDVVLIKELAIKLCKIQSIDIKE